MKSDTNISKYLRLYAEESASWSSLLAGGSFESALVVPVFAEYPSQLERLLSRLQGAIRRLVVVVVNAPAGATIHERELNAAFVRFVFERSFSSREIEGAPLSFHQWNEEGGLHLLVLDASVPALALRAKEGVGRARKMGSDLALALFHQGHLKSHLLGSSDADAELPRDYFELLEQESARGQSISALLFPYDHSVEQDEELSTTMMEVEASFRYYVLGLASAGSPYAYHSLGSALALSLPHYASVRGFPNRQAGEDFYLLSKLSKLAPMRRLLSPRIKIQTRFSSRVPFGTGPSLEKAALEREEGMLSCSSYHPESFHLLKRHLGVLEASVQLEDSALLLEPEGFELSVWEKKLLRKAWHSLAPQLSACPSSLHRRRRLHESVDALAVLRFIHEAHRSGGLEKIPLDQATLESHEIPLSCSTVERLGVLRAKEEALPALVGPRANEVGEREPRPGRS